MNVALAIARQIAEALEAAHELGIVHRDLKPANIKLRPDGTVKVLDFGLAKALDPVAGIGDGSPYTRRGDPSPFSSQSPTMTSPAMTRMGVILGTAAYVSPEQARGKAVDKRTDIWAFGCVLYEMLTGKRAFGGDEITDTLAFIITKEPDWSALPAQTPFAIRQLLRRALVKDPKERLHDIADARIELKDVLSAPDVNITRAAEAPGGNRERVAWAVALLLGVAAVGALAVPYLRTPAVAPETRLEITTPATTDPISFAISPDGRRLVFVASGDGQPRLWLRALDVTTAQPLAGTEGAAFPFLGGTGDRFPQFLPGGRQFLFYAAASPITLILNWSGLRK